MQQFPKPAAPSLSPVRAATGAGLAAIAAVLAIAALPSPAAAACAGKSGGGLAVTTPACAPVKPGKKARIVRGKAIPPKSAPARVKKVIRAANKIRNKPYVWGGGHGSFRDRGYDCSGAVSFALRGGRFIKRPMASTGYMRWKRRGRGRWITVYSNRSHAFLIVAGLRFDTSMTPGNGPGWSKHMREKRRNFSARHPGGF